MLDWMFLSGMTLTKMWFRSKTVVNNHSNFDITYILHIWGQRVIGISGSLICPETLMELIFNPCGEFRWSPEGPVSQIHSPCLHDGTPWIILDLLRSIQMLKKDWGAESNGKLPQLFIPSKTATLVHEFVVEDLPLGRTAVLMPEFAVKDLPQGRTLVYIYIYIYIYQISNFQVSSIYILNAIWMTYKTYLILTSKF